MTTRGGTALLGQLFAFNQEKETISAYLTFSLKLIK